MDLQYELNEIVRIQSMYTEEERYAIAHKYDDIYENLKDYIDEDEFYSIFNIINPIIDEYKEYFNFPRPYTLTNRIEPVYLETAQTPTFPSGHSTQYWFLYLYLKKYKNIDIKSIAKNGSFSRIIAGVHYKMDERAGINLAEIIFNKLEMSRT